ncbi:DUF4129 domain-containing protein [Niastella populi]|uniref:Protein-glutamine gamma-glutamyltransferase-like C-terminal domain-containing protein n=1 Tax=Niastella populi TaxID=550983 RepID=A0A1V9G1W9_9BACT|nr:DUF4129 domain-containing protein [Niastella populi]OQP64572.1 hypothetical protein A4R26_16110 [Niastella populi]
MNYFVSYRLPLPTVKNLRFVLCLAALLSCIAPVRAQDEEVIADTVIAPPVEFNDDNGIRSGTLQEQQPEFRQVPDSAIRSMQKRKDFGYANDPRSWEREPQPEIKAKPDSKGFWEYFYDFFSVTTIRRFTYGLLIAFFAFVVYRIVVVNKLYLFSSYRKARLARGEEEETDIADINFDEKIKQTIAAKEHRLAVRYMYLKALHQLNDKQWIRYHVDGTNHEYVTQMSGRKLANEFSFLTRVYDYVWYGEFAITDEQFDLVQKNFSHFYNAVNS